MKETPTERHHREFAEAQDRVGSMLRDGEKLAQLPEYEVGRSDATSDLLERMERIALMADISNHYIEDMRVMPAEGVKKTVREAMALIAKQESL